MQSSTPMSSPLPVPLPSPLPFVSICTPTFNRRPFIPLIIECIRHQTYPRDRMEWIIVDDGTDKIKDILDKEATDLVCPKTGKSIIHYHSLQKKMTLGRKRNYTHDCSHGDILVYMDDDDYYPPSRVMHAVEQLLAHPHVLCAGSSLLYMYMADKKQMYVAGPYGPLHATAGTLAFRRSLLQETRYDDLAVLGEERFFLKDNTVPMVQLDARKTMVVLSHGQNTFDKNDMLMNGQSTAYMRPFNQWRFEDLVTNERARNMFLFDILPALPLYDAGKVARKPDVVHRLQEMEKEKEKMVSIMYQPDGPNGKTWNLTLQETSDLLKKQNDEIQSLRNTLIALRQQLFKSSTKMMDGPVKSIPEINISVENM